MDERRCGKRKGKGKCLEVVDSLITGAIGDRYLLSLFTTSTDMKADASPSLCSPILLPPVLIKYLTVSVSLTLLWLRLLFRVFHIYYYFNFRPLRPFQILELLFGNFLAKSLPHTCDFYFWRASIFWISDSKAPNRCSATVECRFRRVSLTPRQIR